MEDETKPAQPELAVGITLNADAEGRRELVIEMGGGAMVLGPDLVDAVESVLTGESSATQQLLEATKALAQAPTEKKLLIN